MAIIAVVMFHSRILPGGFLGVDLFFVLSGFLITSLLSVEWERSGEINLKRFYMRRWLRLGPPLLLMLGAFLIFAPIVWPGHNHVLSAAIAAAYVADYTGPLFNQPQGLGHMWSLAIEEQFYLLWPLLLVSLIRSKRAIPILIAAYFVVTIWRCSFTDFRSMYDRFDTHCSGLILGCLFYFVRYEPSRLAFYAACGALGILFCFAPYGQTLPTSLAITVGELAALVVIAGALSFKPALLATAPMVRIGKLSYGIYLWHAPIAWALRDRLPDPVVLAIVAVLSFGAAAISYSTVEAWSRRMRSARQDIDAAASHVCGVTGCFDLVNRAR